MQIIGNDNKFEKAYSDYHHITKYTTYFIIITIIIIAKTRFLSDKYTYSIILKFF